MLLLALAQPFCVLASESIRFSAITDEGHSISIDNIDGLVFRKVEDQELFFGLTKDTIWIKADIEIDSSMQWYLKSCYTQIDRLTAYLPDGASYRVVRTGDLEPVSSRDRPNRCFVFKLSSVPQQVAFFKVRSNGPVSVPIELVSESNLESKELAESYVYGFFFGFLFLLAVYNFLVYFLVKDRAYLYYVFYLIAAMLFSASFSGYGSLYLWPDSPNFTNLTAVIFALLTIIGGLQFVKQISNVPQYHQSLSSGINLLSALFGSLVLLLPISYRFAVIVVLLLTPIAFFLIALAMVVGFRNRWAPSYFVLGGLIVLLPGSLLFVAQGFGFAHSTLVARNALMIGTVLEAIIFSFALAYRIRYLDRRVSAQQREMLGMQKSFSRSLIRASEAERRNLARELHDGIGQNVLAIKSLVRGVADETVKKRVNEQVGVSLSEIRQLAHEMFPQQLEKLGFATAMQSIFTETLEPLGIRTTLEIDKSAAELPREMALHLFRISQEALKNIVTHGNPDRVHVSFTEQNGVRVLYIEDDGIGLSTGFETGLGTTTMKERAELIGGHFDMSSGSSGGTRITVEIT